MVVPEIRPHRAFIAVALLPLVEPLCAFVAFGDGSRLWGRIAAVWMELAPVFQFLAVALSLLALAMVVKGLFGERDPNSRFWICVALAAFFSVTTVHIWYPDEARRSAQGRAEVAVQSTRDALRLYTKRHRTLPRDLDALVPTYLARVPNPRVAGSHLDYRRISESDRLFELTVPCPGSSKPLARYEERKRLLPRMFGR